MLKDFPMFTTKNGVASIKMREIPYSGTAYITIRDSVDPQLILGDCVNFCRAVGAKSIFASGHEFLLEYPLHTHIYTMRASKETIGETDAALFPVTERTLSFFRGFYNEKMKTVPNASYMTMSDAQEILEKKCAYFVHRSDTLLGIAAGSGERLDVVAANIPGAGETLVKAICHALTEQNVVLDVASANTRAINLYERLGFVICEKVATWYKIL